MLYYVFSIIFSEYLLFTGRDELKFVGERRTFRDAQTYCEIEHATLVQVSH